jgi:GPI-anchor transamidase subunit GAA1
LNNLLERFHQSFFFYVIISSDRFISIGDYIPSVGLMAGSLLIKSFLLWLMANNKPDEDAEEDGSKNEELSDKIVVVRKSTRKIEVLKIGMIVLCCHIIGVATLFVATNKTIHDYLNLMNIPTQTGIFYSLITVVVISVLMPKVLRLNAIDAQYLNIIVLLELGTMLLAVSMLNFSLGFFLSLVIAPFAITMRINESSRKNLFKFLIKSAMHLVFHPISILHALILGLTFNAFPEIQFSAVLEKSVSATIDAITYAVVDSLVSVNSTFLVQFTYFVNTFRRYTEIGCLTWFV